MASITGARHFVRDAALYAPGRVAPALSAFLLLTFASRRLAPEALGRYGLVVTSALLGAALLGNWTGQSILRLLPGYQVRGEAQAALSSHGRLLAILWIAGALFAGAFLLLLLAVGSPWLLDASLGSLLLLATLAYDASQAALQAQRRPLAFSLLEAARAGMALGTALALFLLWRSDESALLAGLCAGALVPLTLTIVQARITPAGAQKTAFRAYARAAAAYGLPIMGWFLGIQILGVADRYLVEWLLGSAQLGVYHANYQLLPSIVLIAVSPVLMAAHPLILQAAEGADDAHVERAVERYTRYYLLVALPLGTGTILLAPALTHVLEGPAYWSGELVVPWVVAGYLLWNLGLYGHKRLEIRHRTGTMLALVAVCAVLNVALNLALLPFMGILGAAVATFAAYALYPVLLWLIPFEGPRWVIPWRSVGRIGLATAVAAALAIGAGTLVHPGGLAGAIVMGVVLVLVYVALLLILREVPLEEIREVIHGGAVE